MHRHESGVAERVAMLAHTCYLSDGRVRREAEALAQTGAEVHVISLSERDGMGRMQPRNAVVNGVHVHRVALSRRRGGFLRYCYEYLMMALQGAAKLCALHFRKRLSVVHVHNMPDILVFAALVPRIAGCRVVLDVHDPMPELFASWHEDGNKSVLVKALRLQESLSCRFADNVISVNHTMRENLEAKGVPAHKIFIVHNFPDEAVFPMSPEPVSWPRCSDSLVLLYCGTVTKHYDVGLAVRTVARLSGEVPVRLRIMGEGNCLQQVLQLASSLGVASSVEHIGHVPIERVRDVMRDADVGISCHQGGVFGDLYFSTKVIEYLTQGLPVLCPRTHTIEKYLSDDCLFYFEPGNEAAMADVLRSMWQCPEEVLRRLNTARQLLPRLSWAAEKQQFQSFYSDLMNGRRGSCAKSGSTAPYTIPAVIGRRHRQVR